jgi:hypothetical protein
MGIRLWLLPPTYKFMISLLVGSAFLVAIVLFVFAIFFVFSRVKWADLTSNERSQLISFLLPIGAFSFLSKKIFTDPNFIEPDLCYIFSSFFCVIGLLSIVQKKYFSANLSRWRLLFQRLEIYYTVFFLAIGLLFLLCGMILHLKK